MQGGDASYLVGTAGVPPRTSYIVRDKSNPSWQSHKGVLGCVWQQGLGGSIPLLITLAPSSGYPLLPADTFLEDASSLSPGSPRTGFSCPSWVCAYPIPTS